MKFLNNLSEEEFLEKYWDKKYLFVPNAIPSSDLIFNKDELFEMIQDEYFETKLIETTKDGKISTSEGPITTEHLENLEENWIFMIHNFNLYNQLSSDLEKKVEFLPKWLFDDVMCSYSSKDSTINAHIDKYNVFILQISGKRTWKVQESPDPTYKEDCELRVLKNFSPDKEFTLNPGDMLFIPPNVAHEGHSLEESVSLSIGFKSIEDKDVIEGFLAATLESVKSDEVFKLKTKNPAYEDPYIISKDVTKELHKKVLEAVSEPKIFQDWLANYLSESKQPSSPLENPLTLKEFKLKLSAQEFCFDEHLRMSSTLIDDEYRTHLNNLSFSLSKEQYENLKDITNKKSQVFNLAKYVDLYALFYELYIAGILIPIEE